MLVGDITEPPADRPRTMRSGLAEVSITIDGSLLRWSELWVVDEDLFGIENKPRF